MPAVQLQYDHKKWKRVPETAVADTGLSAHFTATLPSLIILNLIQWSTNVLV
jgi:hypothetical protein